MKEKERKEKQEEINNLFYNYNISFEYENIIVFA